MIDFLSENYLKRTLLLVAFNFCFLISFGHSGNTDSQGGHHNRRTGSYHYHHGSSAHSHPNGICSHFIFYGVIGISLSYFLLRPEKTTKKNKKDNEK